MKSLTEALSLSRGEPNAETPIARGDSGSSIVVDLFRRHANRIRRSLTSRLRNSDDAQDATQEVFLRLWRKEREGNLREEASAYLGVAANSIATDIERWRTFHVIDRLADVDVEDVRAVTIGSDEQQHWRDALSLFVDSVESLPELTRNVFLLHHVKGLTYPEIAARLAVSTRTVERHIAQALSDLEGKLKDFL